ncbi:unnamed protein product [Nyctereutes procyonoides]|uniref:Cytochrome c oxidase assembly protein COX20, mitochondrial n=1 Tax=Nyctereutes procyonoides TaxID=34880 RepID=A0A811ZZF9_NYCPR|nr:unnamed protein product [Nyctereutes procyonoides]
MASTPESGEPTKGKPFKLLGILDVENIPCARDLILYGSLGSVAAGLGHFLLISRNRRSCDVGVGGFILVTLGCWFHCRYNYAKLRIQERIARDGIKNKILKKKIRFCTKVPTLILKENQPLTRAAVEQSQASEYNSGVRIKWKATLLRLICTIKLSIK